MKFSNFISRGLGFCAMIVPGGAFLPPSGRVPSLSVEEWFWMKLIAALMCTVAGPAIILREEVNYLTLMSAILC